VSLEMAGQIDLGDLVDLWFEREGLSLGYM
jgi:hypothetical protein